MTDIATTTEVMSREEGQRLLELERTVEKAVRAAGRIAAGALREIRDAKLYRATHTSFEAYCLDRWGFSRSTAYRIMDSALPEALDGKDAGQSVPGWDISPEAAAIGEASAQATKRRRTTLDQPPEHLDPEPEHLEPPTLPRPPQKPPKAPERPEKPPEAVFPSHNLIPPPPPPLARSARRDAREQLDRILYAISGGTEVEEMAKVATPVERSIIQNFATYFATERRAAYQRTKPSEHEPGCSCLVCTGGKG